MSRLEKVVITGGNGTFTCSPAALAVGRTVTISGTISEKQGSISGLGILRDNIVSPKTYYVIAITGSGSNITGFALSSTSGGPAITTTATKDPPTGLIFLASDPSTLVANYRFVPSRNVIKVLVLGDTSVGKTSFVHFSEDQPQSHITLSTISGKSLTDNNAAAPSPIFTSSAHNKRIVEQSDNRTATVLNILSPNPTTMISATTRPNNPDSPAFVSQNSNFPQSASNNLSLLLPPIPLSLPPVVNNNNNSSSSSSSSNTTTITTRSGKDAESGSSIPSLQTPPETWTPAQTVNFLRDHYGVTKLDGFAKLTGAELAKLSLQELASEPYCVPKAKARLIYNALPHARPTALTEHRMDFSLVRVEASKYSHAATLQLWDIQDVQAVAGLSDVFLRDVHCVVLLFDVTQEPSFDKIASWYPQLKILLSRHASLPFVVFAGNKVDTLRVPERSLSAAGLNALNALATPSSPPRFPVAFTRGETGSALTYPNNPSDSSNIPTVALSALALPPSAFGPNNHTNPPTTTLATPTSTSTSIVTSTFPATFTASGANNIGAGAYADNPSLLVGHSGSQQTSLPGVHVANPGSLLFLNNNTERVAGVSGGPPTGPDLTITANSTSSVNGNNSSNGIFGSGGGSSNTTQTVPGDTHLNSNTTTNNNNNNNNNINNSSTNPNASRVRARSEALAGLSRVGFADLSRPPLLGLSLGEPLFPARASNNINNSTANANNFGEGEGLGAFAYTTGRGHPSFNPNNLVNNLHNGRSDPGLRHPTWLTLKGLALGEKARQPSRGVTHRESGLSAYLHNAESPQLAGRGRVGSLANDSSDVGSEASFMHVSTDMSAGLFVDTPLCARARSWCEAREDENVSLLFCSSHDGAGVRDLLLHVASEARRIKDARRERDAMSQKEDKELRTVWVADENVLACAACAKQFGWFLRKHHCRRCGGVFCDACTSQKVSMPKYGYVEEVRVCAACHVQHLMQEQGLKTNITKKTETIASMF